ncbi:hypothetical protein K438DRAFT_64199 [Mycena galopus ATCC 62051]|nr:hypothetical protein K438DRAFT_64199 [Mycena galopus ATCC 62051]
MEADPEFVPSKSLKAIPRRSPLPGRAKRNNDPAAPDMPQPRRSTAEVTEATTRKALLAVRLAELEQLKISMLAEMELDDEAEEAEDEASSVNMLADVLTMSTAEFGELGAPHSSDEEGVSIDMETFCDVTDLDKDYETLAAEHNARRYATAMKGPTKAKVSA